MFGFWSTFNINILSFISLADAIQLSIYPLIFSSLISFIMGIVTGYLFPIPSLPPGGGVDTPEGIFLNKHKKKIFIPYMIIILILFYGSSDYFIKYQILPILFFTPISITIENKFKILKDIIPLERFTYPVLILILCIPFFVYGQGKIYSNDILKGHAYYVNVNIFENRAVFGNQERVKYLGKNSDFLFFL
ncbi:MAG: hypothetical protein HY578_04445, partial [Nitrospinae bacterium]|nr:hypothetical protein [Nitrospinota bacterium]